MKVNHKTFGELSLPDFLIVGAAKSATTSLHHYLNGHPDVFMPAIKENWFFSFVDNPPAYVSPGKLNNLVSDVNEYSGLFKEAGSDQILGDASPSYLYTYQDTIKNIKAVYPPEFLDKLKIIITLREPVSRAYSQYYTFKRKIYEPLEFEQAVDENTIKKRLAENWNIFYDYTGFGLYSAQVKAFLDEFGEDRVLILLYDDIRADTSGICKKLYSFLDVNSDFAIDADVRHNAVSGEPKKEWLVRLLISKNPVKRFVFGIIKKGLSLLPKQTTKKFLDSISRSLFVRKEMNEDTRLKLSQIFNEDIIQLESLIKRDLSTWRKKV